MKFYEGDFKNTYYKPLSKMVLLEVSWCFLRIDGK